MTDTEVCTTVDSQWTAAALGLRVDDAGGGGWDAATLVVPGLRRNPRRAHLLVSTVLGKHIPTDPALVRAAADALGDKVAAAAADLRPDVRPADAVVFGFAETATGLGHGVAARLGSRSYLHSTRRERDDVVVLGEFVEGHSHATRHLIAPTSPELFGPVSSHDDSPLILVDDEISTGATALDAIRALHDIAPRSAYIVASLIDMRTAAHRHANSVAAQALGVEVVFVSLATGSVTLPDELVTAVAELVGDRPNPVAAHRGSVDVISFAWPAKVSEGGRYGFPAADRAGFDSAVTEVAALIAPRLSDADTVVVGHEELMYAAQCIAERLCACDRKVRYQTTTRSPAVILDEPGYPLRRGFEFAAPEPDPAARRYLYNATVDPDAPAQIVLILDSPADTTELRQPGGLLDVVTAAGHDVLAVVLDTPSQADLRNVRRRVTAPLRGPQFGSYAADEVGWLLKDLSGVRLEADIAERESRIQSGTAHYAESLPIEYEPTAEYRKLFDDTLAASAARLAQAVGTVTELLIAERGTDLTLVSLARAGTPVGILMRRWAQNRHGTDWPHYAVSIVRDRGIDTAALDYVVDHHDPSSVVFVDGWTGKGAIARELTAALHDYAAAGGPALNDELAVLADPGSCTTMFGTRNDFLIASACLNSTVSGLVSRTVLNDQLIGPGEFHGAKFYADLAAHDVSNRLLDTVSAEFDAVAPAAAAAAAELRGIDRTPTWSGWRSVAKVQREYGISSINYVKPGVGETTRVLLRRVPWRILVRDPDAPEHAHIRLLAADRNVPVEVVDDLAYSCMGLIAPADHRSGR